MTAVFTVSEHHFVGEEDDLPDCKGIYCGARLVSGVVVPEPDLVTYFNDMGDYQFGSENPIISRINGLLLYGKNAPNIIIILKSQGNTSSVDPGYYFHGHENITVHGSLSTYDSNILFYMFYPYNDQLDVKSNMSDFLTNRDLPGTYVLTNELRDIFFDVVDNSNELFME